MPPPGTSPVALRAWSLILLLSLLTVAGSYLAPSPLRPAVLIVLLAAGVIGAMVPATAIAATLGIAPIVDGLVALLHGFNPAGHQKLGLAWIEPVFLGVTAGLLVRRLWRGQRGPAAVPAARVYVAAMVGVLAVALAPYVADWRGLSGYPVLLMWRALPGFDQGAPEHLLRAGFLLLAAPLWLSAVVDAVRTPTEVRRARVAWLAGAVVAAVYGHWMWTHGQGQTPPRVESLLDDVNSYGSYLVLSLFMAIVVLADERRRDARILAGLALVATTWMLFLSASRVALFAAFAAAVAAVLFGVPRRRLLVGATFLLLVLGAVAGVRMLGTDASHSWRVVRSATDPGLLVGRFVEMRQAVWSATARAFLDRPLAGVGPGRLYASLNDYYRPEDTGWRPVKENAHSYLLQLAAETGVVGLAAFAWLLAATLAPAFRDAAGGMGGRRVLAIGALGYLATCLSGHPLILSRQIILFWGFVGLLAVSSAPVEAPQPVTSRAVRWSPWVLAPVLGVAIIVGPPTRPCPASGDRVSIAYGLGFYPGESTATETWRWMRDAGALRLCNATGAPIAVDLQVPLRSFNSPRTVSAYIRAQRVARDRVERDPMRVMTLSSRLPPGWTTVALVPAPGPQRVDPILHNGDQRSVSVRVGNAAVSVKPAG